MTHAECHEHDPAIDWTRLSGFDCHELPKRAPRPRPHPKPEDYIALS